jgi:hypothetical protein
MPASNQTRPLSNIAHDIKRDWKPVNYAAVPYLATMLQMDKITDAYMYDDGRSIVRYFLSNARTWRGPVAKTIKAELKGML